MIPNEPGRVDALRDVLALGPEGVLDALAAARQRERDAIDSDVEEQ
jgi:hypothetical protein